MAFPKSLADVPSDASALAYAFAMLADCRTKIADAMQGLAVDSSTKEFVDDLINELGEHVDGIRRKIVAEHPQYRKIGSSAEPSEDQSCALLLLSKSVEFLASRGECFKTFVSAQYATKSPTADDYMERLRRIGEPASADVEDEGEDDRLTVLMKKLQQIGS